MGNVVAVVDDEPVLCEVLTEVLDTEGYGAQAFSSAGACLKALEEGFRPGLIFVDLRMRGMSGAEFVRRVRAAPWGASIRIYVVSGSMLDEDYPPRATIDGVIGKPFNLEEIVEITARHVGRSGSGRDRRTSAAAPA